jgi:hypothetical protein
MNRAPIVAGPDEWKFVSCMSALGYTLGKELKAVECISATRRNCWGAFWLNHCRALKAVSLGAKGGLFRRAVSRVFRFRVGRWPWYKNLETFVNIQQNNILSVLAGVRFKAGQSWSEFGRAKTDLIRTMNVPSWGSVWAATSAGWQRNIARHQTDLPYKALMLQSAQHEINALNRTRGMLSSRRSRLGTRSCPGPPTRSLETRFIHCSQHTCVKWPQWLRASLISAD